MSRRRYPGQDAGSSPLFNELPTDFVDRPVRMSFTFSTEPLGTARSSAMSFRWKT